MNLTAKEKSFFCAGINKVFGDAAADVKLADKLLLGSHVFVREFSDGETVYENLKTESALGFFVGGGADIVRVRGECEVYLRKMGGGDVFGAAVLFCDDSTYVTSVRAKGKTKVVFLPEENLRKIMLEIPSAALGYISFLTEKIRFLNRKISTFTAGSATEKLAEHILQGADDGGVYAPSISYSRIADMLGLGRASLYRAIDELCEKGLIRKEQKNIIIIDREGLASI